MRVTVGLDDRVPALPADVIAALGADTLLSEKFIGLSAGTAGGPLLAEGAVIQGIAQPTFDDLVRSGADVFGTLNKMLPEVKVRMDELLPKLAGISDAARKVTDDLPTLFAKANTLMDNLVTLSNSGNELINGDAKKLMGSANEVAGDAKSLIGGANRLLTQHEADLSKTLDQLPEVLGHLDTLLGRTQGMLTSNEKDLNATIRDLRVVMQEMRLTAVNAKKVMATLANGRPTRLIWTRDDEPQNDTEMLQRQKPDAPATSGRTPSKVGAGKR